MKNLEAMGLYPIAGEYQPVKDEELVEIEDTRGFALPPDFKSFIKKYGWSGFFPRAYVKPIDPIPPQVTDEDVLGFVCFYGAEIDRGGLLSMTRAKFTESMPSTVIPFAESDGSSQYLIGLGGDDLNKVYFWNFEEWPDPDDYEDQGLEIPEGWQYENMILVAESFTDFLNRLVPGPRDKTLS
ncbi:MAG: SMI1/KNR4 family protein [Candidatus Obscuribacterales bacterium]|nr:SMI1/KNR4 family protein [Cyanobacteria bacterium HKST-UBA01]MCB9469090.1 SMI1/KNR4 family protein [Candidatus Obscuribacterales bacterium]